VVGIVVLFIFIELNGCIGEEGSSEDNPKVLNLGDSIIHRNIKITFLSAYWEELDSWGKTITRYNLDLKGENIGLEKDSVYVEITKYEMANGYSYSSSYALTSFTLEPGRNSTESIRDDREVIDRDFLPVVKIYITIDENLLPLTDGENVIYAILNV